MLNYMEIYTRAVGLQITSDADKDRSLLISILAYQVIDALSGGWRDLSMGIPRWIERRITLATLRDLDHRILRDIGVDPFLIEREVERRFSEHNARSRDETRDDHLMAA